MTALPDRFLEMLAEVVPAETAAKVAEAILNTPPVTSIRLNPLKRVSENVSSVVNIALEQNQSVPWCTLGYYLNERPSFTMDPSLHAGAYYVQEASSMALHLLKPFLEDKMRVLDLCAAPGGKSTHLVTLLNQKSQLTVNEVIKSRLSALRENILKWGDHSVKILSRDAREIAESGAIFDFILVDAPCSGEGMFRKERGAIKEWSEEGVHMCAARQRRILSDIWSALEPEGYLAYTTCTFNRYENDLNVEWIKDSLGAEYIPLESISPQWGVIEAPAGGYRFMPGVVKGEGLFLALFRKPSGGSFSTERNYGGSFSTGKPSGGDPEYSVFAANSSFQYPTYELTKECALQYLNRQAIKIPDAPIGLIVVTYGGLPLGLAKNIGTRANNLYPTGWRIKNLK